MKELIYNKQDYKKIKNYLYENNIVSRNLKIRFKEKGYSEFFGTNATVLSFNAYDNEIVCSYILENENKDQEYSYYIFNDYELKELNLLKEYEVLNERR